VHEVSIALAIIDEISERAIAENIEAIEMVRLRIGVMTGVVPDALQFAWDLAAEGTVAAGSRLEIERVALTIACATCACERPVEDRAIPVPICAVCGDSSTEIVRGRELLIVAMEVRDPVSS
jgi:hydrogenase nickel incorporation protein HypA/HybF